VDDLSTSNLIWMEKGGKTTNLLEKPFHPEKNWRISYSKPREYSGRCSSSPAKLKVKQNRTVTVPLFRYQEEWKQALYKVEGLDFDVRKLMPVFEAAYENIPQQPVDDS
jgi:hypothetical protein